MSDLPIKHGQAARNEPLNDVFKGLFADICGIVDAARTRFANSANAEIVLEYWSIGTRINKEVLCGKRARYGDRTIERLSNDLCRHYVTNEFKVRNLRRMMQFAQEFPQLEIVSRAATQLSWSHIVEILPLRDGVQREFYLTLAATQKWGRDELRGKIDGMLFERTAISGTQTLVQGRSNPGTGEIANLRRAESPPVQTRPLASLGEVKPRVGDCQTLRWGRPLPP